MIGISVKIRNAYSFVAHNYQKGDEIILVGFSRGAFAVQCLASLISQAGLLEKKYLYYLRGMFKLWANQEIKGGSTVLGDKVEILKRAGVLHEVRIKALAVWDTVSSLGIPTQVRPRPLSFVGKKVPEGVDHAFHALALDEKRRKFQPCIWDSLEEGGDDTTVSQCWFLGNHGDVGGNGDAALGAVTLLWMIGKLHDFVDVAFEETEIGKHLKHKYLEWEFDVSRLFKSFRETRVLSTMPHSGKFFNLMSGTIPALWLSKLTHYAGQAGKAAWYWRFLGWKPRANFLKSTVSNDNLTVEMEIHFTVRLAISAGKNKCSALQSWKTILSSNEVQWQSGDGSQTINEHILEENMEGETEYNLLSNWCQDKFLEIRTERAEFVELQERIQDKDSEHGLKKFSLLLKNRMKFERGILAPAMMVPAQSVADVVVTL